MLDVDMILALLGMSWISDGNTASATRSNSLPSCCDMNLPAAGRALQTNKQ